MASSSDGWPKIFDEWRERRSQGGAGKEFLGDGMDTHPNPGGNGNGLRSPARSARGVP